MNIQVKFDISAVKHMQRDIPQNIIPTVLMRSLNKTLQATQSTAIKNMANQIGVKQKILRDFLSMTKAQKQKLTAILSAPHKKRLTLLMIDSHAKQNARGVAYRIDGQRKQLDHAFIALMKNGHCGIYARKPGVKRLPIRELQGPSVAYLFMQPETQAAMKNTVDDRWPPLLEHELHYALQRGGYLK
jgi:hypothetical protein